MIEWINNITGWKRRFFASFLGALAALALPPIYLLPLLIPAFSGLFLLIRNAKNTRQAFWTGWWWGLGYFTVGLYWICISLFVEPEKFAWLTPFALLGLPSILAIYIGVFACVFRLCENCVSNLWQSQANKAMEIATNALRSSNDGLLVGLFSILWIAFEYLRSKLFTGFAWNLIGYVFTVSDITLQPASVIGIYGLSFLVVLFSTMPVLFLLNNKRALLYNLLNVVLLVIILVFGYLRLEHNPTQYSNVKLRIVQANIPQSLKWDAKEKFNGFKKHIDLMQKQGLDNINIVIFPESGIPYYVNENPVLISDIGRLLPEKTILLTGGLRGQGDEKNWQAWNSLFAINHEGKIIAQYDKHHLVPFGEFIPFRNILPLENIAGGIGDFSRGAGAETLFVGDYPPFSPLICYEAVFPDETTDKTGRAKWLIQITNDAWFGISSGPYQHLQMARVRAVEQGLPLVRAANTGISAIFDPLGRMVVSLPLGKDGVIDAYLPLGARD